MSEKQRQKKDGEDKNKNDRRMRARNADVDERDSGHPGNVKKRHGVDSTHSGYSDYGDQT